MSLVSSSATAAGPHRSEAIFVAPLSGSLDSPSPIGVRLPHFPRVGQHSRSPPSPTLSPSNHGHSAVDVQRLSGHIGRFIGGQERDRRGNLFRRSGAAR